MADVQVTKNNTKSSGGGEPPEKPLVAPEKKKVTRILLGCAVCRRRHVRVEFPVHFTAHLLNVNSVMERPPVPNAHAVANSIYAPTYQVSHAVHVQECTRPISLH